MRKIPAPHVNRKEKDLYDATQWWVMDICGVLRNLVPFVQFKKREKHPRNSATFSKVAGYSLQAIKLY